MARSIPNPTPGALEGELAREFAPLITARCMVAPGENGQAELHQFAHAVGAAGTRYGGMMAGAQSAENFLLAQSPAAPDRPQRLVAAVCEGNYKSPVTVLAGMIALSELHRHVLGPHGSVEDDVRLALVETLQRFAQIEAATPPHQLAQWRFGNFVSGSSATPNGTLQGLVTSFTALIVEGHEVLLAHIGESLASRVHARGRSRQRLSADHTFAGDPEFHQRHAADSFMLEFMHDSPRFVLGGCALADIQIEWFPLTPGDTLLLSSSSLSKGPVREDLLVQTLIDCEPALARDRLLALAPLQERAELSATVVVLRPPY